LVSRLVFAGMVRPAVLAAARVLCNALDGGGVLRSLSARSALFVGLGDVDGARRSELVAAHGLRHFSLAVVRAVVVVAVLEFLDQFSAGEFLEETKPLERIVDRLDGRTAGCALAGMSARVIIAVDGLAIFGMLFLEQEAAAVVLEFAFLRADLRREQPAGDLIRVRGDYVAAFRRIGLGSV